MLASYANGESVISRSIIEEVAANLDLLPQNHVIQNHSISTETPKQKVKILTDEAEQEFWQNQEKAIERKTIIKENDHERLNFFDDDRILEIEDTKTGY
jgi:hypothetical protein